MTEPGLGESGVERNEISEAAKVAALIGYVDKYPNTPLARDIRPFLKFAKDIALPGDDEWSQKMAGDPEEQHASQRYVDALLHERIISEVGEQMLPELVKRGSEIQASGGITEKGISNEEGKKII